MDTNTDSELVKDLRYALQCCEDHGLHIGELKRAIPQVEALMAAAIRNTDLTDCQQTEEKAKSDE